VGLWTYLWTVSWVFMTSERWRCVIVSLCWWFWTFCRHYPVMCWGPLPQWDSQAVSHLRRLNPQLHCC
jgi:hypothetical protein